MLSRPNPQFTPGEICQPTDKSFKGFFYPGHVAICKRDVTSEEKEQVAREYGNIPRALWSEYEFDHLIPVCAGGSSHIKNIWPQPKEEAKRKDKIEDQACEGMKKGQLTQAQAIEKIHQWFISPR